jgi:ornithine decarboxylase
MGLIRFRSAASPLRRRFDSTVGLRPTVDDVVAAERPQEPVYCLRPETICASARTFAAAFPGEVLYAVKSNPEPAVLRAVWAGGIRHFDCASLAEVSLVRQMFAGAAIHFMHPVKSRAAIGGAWADHGVRDFVFDSAFELTKILSEVTARGTPAAERDLGLFLRLAVPAGRAAYDLSGKFGAAADEAPALLRIARPHAARLGVSFHVGSQCLAPGDYHRAITVAAEVIANAGVAVDVIDVGGGFPVSYADATPPSLGRYMAEIEAAAAASTNVHGCALWAEPGRALVAAGASLVVQVHLRKGTALYINDGIYGSLSDAGVPGFRFPVRLIRPDGPPPSPRLVPFSLFGPTCDSADRMAGPFCLPADVGEGDWIEIGQLGAYGACLRTAFNGFDRVRILEVADPPLLATPGYPVG